MALGAMATQLCSLDASENMDRISCLPKHLVDHVLSFLPTQDMVGTCLLSRRWRTMWCSVSSLDIDESLFSKPVDFITFVDSLLLLRDGSRILKFRIYINKFSSLSRLNAWIIYALRHSVDVLHVDVFHKSKVTPHVFSCESLREFKLSNSFLDMPASICLPALKVLHLCRVRVQDGQLNKTILAIPSLQTLVLENCHFKNHNLLVIYASRLEVLMIKGSFPASTEISAPNLITLELHCPRLGSKSITFMSRPPTNLKDATIQFLFNDLESLIELVTILHNTSFITLSALFLMELVAYMEANVSLRRCFQTPFHSLRLLKFGTTFSDGEMLLINTILDHSPRIETVLLENEVGEVSYNNTKVKAEKVWFKHNHKLSRLNLVEIKGFRGSKNEVRFVKFIVENAIVLDRLIITTSKSEETTSGSNQDMMKTGRELLKYPRASSSLGILFG